MKKIFLISTIVCPLILSAVNAWSQEQEQVLDFQVKEVVKLPGKVNSDAEEGFPLVSPDGNTLYFVRTFHKDNIGGEGGGQDIWYSKMENGQWSKPQNDLSRLNDLQNNAVSGISGDGNKLYLQGTYSNKIDLIKGVSYTVQENGIWTKPKHIHVPRLFINSEYYGVSMNDSGDVLLISMNGKKSMGEEDLYVCLKDNHGKWSNPIHLGDSINSKGYEISPFLDPDGVTLYYGSNGLGGLGDVDIFMTKRLDSTWTRWTTPVNLGSPINSSGFDSWFFKRGDDIYFASNRDGDLSDLYSSIALPPPVDNMVVDVAGIFKNNGDARKSLSLNLFDSRDSLMQSVTTDESGYFKFEKLPAQQEFFIKVEEEDLATLGDAQIFLVNEKGANVQVIEQQGLGSFAFTTLPRDEFDSLPELEIEEPDIPLLLGAFFYKGLPADSIKVKLMDENDNPLQYTTTNGNGEFAFRRLDADKNYLIVIDEDDEDLRENAKLFLMDEYGGKKMMVANQSNGIFGYKTLPRDEFASLPTIPEVDVDEMLGFTAMGGILEYSGYAAENVEIQLMNSSNEQVQSTSTDENGQFVFRRLSPDEEYLIQINEEDPAKLAHADLFLTDFDGNKVMVLNPTSSGVFAYKCLKREEVAALPLLEEEDLAIEEVSMQGVYEYNKLPGDHVKLMLVDEFDNVVAITETNEKGEFEFEKLRADKNYFVKMVEGSDPGLMDDGELFLLGADGGKLMSSQQNEKGEFNFTALSGDLVTSLSKIEAQNMDIELDLEGWELVEPEVDPEPVVVLTSMRGVVESNGDPAPNVRLMLFNENDSAVGNTVTDSIGEFVFRELNADKNYSVQINEEDQSAMVFSEMYLIDEKGEKVLVAESVTAGEFKFKPLTQDLILTLAQVEAEDLDINIDMVGWMQIDDAPKEIAAPKRRSVSELISNRKIIDLPLPKIVEAKPVVKEEPKEEVAEKVKEEKKEEVAPVEIPKSDVTVAFGWNVYTLTNNDRYLIRTKVLPVLSTNNNVTVDIYGHTDNVGSKYNNQKVSEYRAVAIKRYLVEKGIAANRIRTKGFGSDRPAGDNAEKPGRRKNRRAEIVFKRNSNS